MTTTSALFVGFFMLAFAPGDPSKPSSESPGGKQVSTRLTAQTDRAQIQAGTASLVLESKTQGVVATQSTPTGFWPFQVGDVVRRIDGRVISRPSDALFVWRESAGSVFNFEVLRNGQVVTFRAGPSDFPGLNLPPTPEPPAPPPPPGTMR
ncbi:hypothetical protein D187_006884 [Cystobacter fuscus DSM 2262]|uniref:PDZ domain-containing protein n=1 Tax=Cystobacter fuscus (strain ATCC 25194 / DSM 2262 / NBRC 100088 / M29) TaxID=1242864 RepID=S9NY73_CYSF2|nr:hypothetical protein [Cystobacter fuscus]EPX57130.1 hypothetical protein D187_006884 [Cystobacter fuscus DSM 2262]